MYLSYEEYQFFGGTLDEATFDDYEFEARSIIDWYTFNRLANDTEIPEAVKRCMYRLIQLAKLKADSLRLGETETQTTEGGTTTTTVTSAPIASQSNDGVSISYNTMSAADAFSKVSSTANGNEIELTVQRYLNNVVNEAGRKVLYRGIYPDE